jgi:hypothetical protein
MQAVADESADEAVDERAAHLVDLMVEQRRELTRAQASLSSCLCRSRC